MNNEIDNSYNEFKQKLNKIKCKYPKLAELWLCYLKQHTNLYKKVLKDVHNFIITVDDTLLNKDLNEMNILLLYFILDNDIKI
jgi:hypothetical protein